MFGDMGRLISYGVLCLFTNLIMFPGKVCSPFAALLCSGQYESLITVLIAGTHWQSLSLERKENTFHLSGTLSADICGSAHILHWASVVVLEYMRTWCELSEIILAFASCVLV